jgi:CRP/FNR family cyclic AMP-dependent transcriptional regulator
MIGAMADLAQSLARIPLFAGLGKKDLKRLAKQMSERSFSEGDAIATEGQPGVGFFLIEDGSAQVSIDGETIRTLGPGDHFGEIALIDEGPRSATVVAATDLRCRGMSSWEFRPLVQKHPEFAWPLLQALTGYLRESGARGRS